ncbi:MAG: Uncharacterised protein [Prochlorococcus marinus str. MIT 9215]|nr:MAG: Uncharacterised protein [Prochlorococcus marinus str. MIT 9215]
MPDVNPDQPILILGGFLITEEAYTPLASWLQTNHGLTVKVVPSSKIDWFLTSWRFGWKRLLDRVDRIVHELKAQSPTGKVTLIGHSSGGVMLRLYLGDKSFAGRIYSGYRHVNRLVMLGSPNQAVRATALRALVDRLYPGCTFSDYVDYVSVAGILDPNGEDASWFSRNSFQISYEKIMCDADALGDGLVPLDSAILLNSKRFVLENTAHAGLFGRYWYGSPACIEKWWPLVVQAN